MRSIIRIFVLAGPESINVLFGKKSTDGEVS
jgi:hypothetical protein